MTGGLTGDALLGAAQAVLRGNDLGHMVKAGPRLYPHQWSWDAAFISIGLAHESVPRALTELRTVLSSQWSTGMVPHIVFSDVPDYFPGPEVWGTSAVAAKPPGIATSGICQPPVHAIAAGVIAAIARERGETDVVAAFLDDGIDRLHAWHEWLTKARVSPTTGLIEIHHGWESGMDNSPRFDAIYAAIDVPVRKELPRTDLHHAEASMRPSDEEYQRYIWLVDQMRSVDFDDRRVAEVVDFRCGDVFMTAVLALAAESLARLAIAHRRPAIAAAEADRANACRAAVLASIDPATGRCRDFDVRRGEWLEVESIAGFSALICGGPVAVLERQRELLRGPRWMSHPGLAYRLPPSVSPESSDFRPREYWRGPVWPFLNWFLSYAALGQGEVEFAHDLRREGLAQLGDGAFGEYYEPLTAEPLGSPDQSWTAMAAIDWLRSSRWRR